MKIKKIAHGGQERMPSPTGNILFPLWVKNPTPCNLVTHSYVTKTPHGVVHQTHRFSQIHERYFRSLRWALKDMPYEDLFNMMIDSKYAYNRESLR